MEFKINDNYITFLLKPGTSEPQALSVFSETYAKDKNLELIEASARVIAANETGYQELTITCSKFPSKEIEASFTSLLSRYMGLFKNISIKEKVNINFL